MPLRRSYNSKGGRHPTIVMKPQFTSIGWYRAKVVVVIELITLMMAFALPFIPRRGSGELINLPSDASGYLYDVLIGFGLLNGLMVAVAAAGWIYWIANGRRSSKADEATNAGSSSES